ncbi:hypothetical protein M3596_21415 [Bacillus subtilis]|uniref:hypothetical protein n=1 Tax=Bacillus subtilis TaxID=1423 RepID=UPI00203B43AB|nr:hypothetical protein [Bacillus subtilis]MCM3191276.1 hypothetical protein [Bacillus subtilis]
MRKILHNIGDNTVKYWMYSIIASLFIVLIGFFLRSSVMLEIGYLLAPLSFIFMAAIHIYLCIDSGIRYLKKRIIKED